MLPRHNVTFNLFFYADLTTILALHQQSRPSNSLETEGIVQEYMYLTGMSEAGGEVLQFYMNLDHQDRSLQLQDFFQESKPLNRSLPPLSELHQPLLREEDFDLWHISKVMNLTVANPQPHNPNPPVNDDCSEHPQHNADDTNPLEELLNSHQLEPLSNPISLLEEHQPREEAEQPESPLPSAVLAEVIGLLVEQAGRCSKEQLDLVMLARFPGISGTRVVQGLVERFRSLRKTKEELVKYCMRKAFKFILELPKNKHLLEAQKAEKYSFSKCKSRYLKKVSEEKSMNNRFLRQIFQEGDFTEDYQAFLGDLDRIIATDNQHKVDYLAQTLSQPQTPRTADMVKRLPWTEVILERVRKISRQLLKHGRHD